MNYLVLVEAKDGTTHTRVWSNKKEAEAYRTACLVLPGVKAAWLYQEAWQADEAFSCLRALHLWAAEMGGWEAPAWQMVPRVLSDQRRRSGAQ